MRGPAGIGTQEWGLGCGLAASLLPESGEAQGAGRTHECRPGPGEVTQDALFVEGETGPCFGCVC